MKGVRGGREELQVLKRCSVDVNPFQKCKGGKGGSNLDKGAKSRYFISSLLQGELRCVWSLKASYFQGGETACNGSTGTYVRQVRTEAQGLVAALRTLPTDLPSCAWLSSAGAMSGGVILIIVPCRALGGGLVV